MLRSLKHCERSAWTCARKASNASIGKPWGFAGVLSIKVPPFQLSLPLLADLMELRCEFARRL